MYVKQVDIKNFRNYKNQSLKLSSGINVFAGDNAQGKTNFLEAVYFSSIGKSPRTTRDKELILWDNDSAVINLIAQKSAGDDAVKIVISKHENKRIAINNMPISRIGELMGVVSTVFFSPSELRIVQASPSERRSFMDIAICQMSKAYFYLLIRYNKILSQRNKLLKSGRVTDDALEVWDAQLVQVGSKIIKTRKGFVSRLMPFAKANHSFLSGGKEELILAYEGMAGDELDTIAESFLTELKRTREKDLRLGYTHTGPQKDDISLKIGQVDVRTFGSQGQQRTTALSLKLSELDLAKETLGEYPVLLLDDVLSELDPSRQAKLLERIAGFQTLITCTHLEDTLVSSAGEIKEFRVKGGCIEEV